MPENTENNRCDNHTILIMIGAMLVIMGLIILIIMFFVPRFMGMSSEKSCEMISKILLIVLILLIVSGASMIGYAVFKQWSNSQKEKNKMVGDMKKYSEYEVKYNPDWEIFINEKINSVGDGGYGGEESTRFQKRMLKRSFIIKKMTDDGLKLNKELSKLKQQIKDEGYSL